MVVPELETSSVVVVVVFVDVDVDVVVIVVVVVVGITGLLGADPLPSMLNLFLLFRTTDPISRAVLSFAEASPFRCSLRVSLTPGNGPNSLFK
ncbi:hypothetical protein BO86DRAFT_389507 [Aspergillus japonicus CBS 114.51]|uniref:Uncharacterized protein n=1 Tax=Aspergillus japonicus CBS 114.51 TaxID=1448312 RepID=A0A8T8X060_ASPJA|nr:hypothetical protein BO86DRAFT_389507 [Aspergillus japonicus CBS 114.51]RAH81536.1 hypothetical protein BO86DRAFT_389507 [Aspergillus japonicus CBS 114.51]